MVRAFAVGVAVLVGASVAVVARSMWFRRPMDAPSSEPLE